MDRRGAPDDDRQSGGVLEYACHEGNYAIVTALGGALARDAALESK